jgi:hypothetical protein
VPFPGTCFEKSIMPYLKFALAALLFSTLPFSAEARDLDKSDPVRKELLDLARRSPEDRFIVRDMYRTSDLAFMCGTKTWRDEAGFHEEEGGEDHFLYVRNGKHWVAFNLDYLMEGAAFGCDFFPIEWTDAPYSNDDEMLLQPWKQIVLDFALTNPDESKWTASQREAIATMHQKNLLQDLPVDDFTAFEGRVSLNVDVGRQLDDCHKNVTCINKVNAPQERLMKLAKSGQISAAVWAACTKPIPAMIDSQKKEQCIAAFRVKTYCRKGMDYFRDHADVSRCITEIDHYLQN